jgi:hypothetical protein
MKPVHFMDAGSGLVPKVLFCLCAADRAIFCRFAKFDIATHRAKIKVHIQVLALLHGLESKLVQFGVHLFGFQGIFELLLAL